MRRLTLAIALLAGCNSAEPLGEGPDCIACRADGETCDFSINCPMGSICNHAEDELFDPREPPDRCLRVVCNSDPECAPGEHCNLIGLCRPHICQGSAECPSDQRCLGGRCVVPPPIVVTGCRLIAEPRVVVRGERSRLHLIAVGPGDVVVPEVQADLQSMDPAVVRISGGDAFGDLQQGRARLTATIGDVSCSTEIINLAPLAPEVVRVVVVAAEDGSPLPGAQVNLQFLDSPAVTATTGLLGATEPFVSSAQLRWATAAAPGREVVSILRPGNDVLIALSRAEPRASAGGSRGYVTLPPRSGGDIVLALAGHAAPSDFFSLPSAINRWFCSSAPLQITAPDIGLENETINFPEGMVVALGNKHATEDPMTRCRNAASPGAEAVGCYLATGDMSSSALFGFGGRIKLSTFLSRFEDSTPGCREDVGGLFSLLSLLSEGRHGIAPFEEVQEFPLVPRIENAAVDCARDSSGQCRPDYLLFRRRDLEVSAQLELMSAIKVPPTVADGPFCHNRVMVLAGARLPGRGWLPIGFGASETQQCEARSEPDAIGERTPQLPIGTLPLVAAPLHGGAEGSDRGLVAMSLSRRAFGSNTTSLSMIYEKVDRLSLRTTMRTSFLDVPSVRRWPGPRDLHFDDVVTDATARRVRFIGPDGTWTVFFSPSVRSLVLPEISWVGPLLAAPQLFEIAELRLDDTTFADLWRFPSGAHPHRLFERPTAAIALRRCSGTLNECS